MWAAGYKSCSICGLLNGMWAVVGYVGCCMVYGLLDIRAAVYVGCGMVCGLLYGMWAAGYKSCSICGLLNGMWAVVWFVRC